MPTPVTMRRPTSLAIAAAVLLSTPVFAGEVPTRARLPPIPPPGPIEQTLSAADLMKTFEADYLPQVRECWLQHASRQKRARGHIVLGLVINPVGIVTQLDISAPGVKGTRFETCLLEVAAEWHFPDRTGWTEAQIPILLVKTRAPGAGPMKK
jgi:hypothetical protein